MNILGITPNTLYASFIDNQEIVKNMKICEKLSTLSEEKKDFLNSLIDLLQALN